MKKPINVWPSGMPKRGETVKKKVNKVNKSGLCFWNKLSHQGSQIKTVIKPEWAWGDQRTAYWSISARLGLLANGAVLLSGLGAGGSMDWLNRGGQGTEEARNEGEAEAAPRTKHRPAVAMADVVREAVQVPWVTGKFKINSGNTCAQGDDAEGAWKENMD